jgi:hypothetical protein
MQVSLSGGLGEIEVGGATVNFVPKTGGNKFSGTGFVSDAGKWSQGDNLDDRLQSFGIRQPPTLFKNWDVSGSVGGPIVKGSSLVLRQLPATSVRTMRSWACTPTRTPGNASSWRYDRTPACRRAAPSPPRSSPSPDRPAHAAEQNLVLLRLSESVQRLDADQRR